MKDKEKVKQFMRIYKQEEINSMNYILGKTEDNLYFTEEEIELCSKIDLFDRETIKICKHIYEKEVMNNGNPSINNSENQVVENQQV